jgi:hypothetical protein
MTFRKISLFFSVLMFTGNLASQQQIIRETTIHKNVRLIEMAMPKDVPEELKANYREFLPQFEEVLVANTADQPSDREITFRITPDIKEIGAAKTKRVIVRIAAFRRNSTMEFVGNLMLYSYATGEKTSRDEIEQCLMKQLLGPLEM